MQYYVLFVKNTSCVGFTLVYTLSDFKIVDVSCPFEASNHVVFDFSVFIFSNWLGVYSGGLPCILRDFLGDSARWKFMKN